MWLFLKRPEVHFSFTRVWCFVPGRVVSYPGTDVVIFKKYFRRKFLRKKVYKIYICTSFEKGPSIVA
jgi:hypothetical protein